VSPSRSHTDTPPAYFSSDAHDWATPRYLFDQIHGEFNFTIDVCAAVESACLGRFWTEYDDALLRSWEGERVWMNPPFGRQIKRWMEKAWNESAHTELIVCLCPSRTDTEWWHEYAMRADEIRFLRGRLSFNDGPGRAPFPSSLVIWR